MIPNSYAEQIVSTAGSWSGVELASLSGGGTVLSVAGREFAHVHPSGVVDVPTTRELRDQLLTDGIADRHHAWPRSSWVTYRVRSRADVPGAVRLLRFAYLCQLLALENRSARRGDDPVPGVDADAELARLGVSPELAELAVQTFPRPVSA